MLLIYKISEIERISLPHRKSIFSIMHRGRLSFSGLGTFRGTDHTVNESFSLAGFIDVEDGKPFLLQ
jgi:hypothetical protein